MIRNKLYAGHLLCTADSLSFFLVGITAKAAAYTPDNTVAIFTLSDFFQIFNSCQIRFVQMGHVFKNFIVTIFIYIKFLTKKK